MSEKDLGLALKALIGHMYMIGGMIAPSLLIGLFLLAMAFYYFYVV